MKTVDGNGTVLDDHELHRSVTAGWQRI